MATHNTGHTVTPIHNAAGGTGPRVGRLAPSPTGQLHLGNARTFLLAWLSVRQQQGTLLLRLEDIDLQRNKPGASQAVIDDLHWLGLDWDYGPNIGDGTCCGIPLLQTHRLDRYRQVLQQLLNDHQVYPCHCTRSQIAQAAASAPHESSLAQREGPVYPGTCRSIGDSSQITDLLALPPSVALRWAFAAGTYQWHDGLLGPQSACPQTELGDFVIGRGSGLPAYQLAVVVDDHDQGVTEVVRGDDLKLSTYRQLAILRHLGWAEPMYYHVPLLLDAEGHRLAKRRGDSLAAIRQQGISSQTVIGKLAYSLGLIDRPQPIEPSELIAEFCWSRVHCHSTSS
ncbi:MAG: tRNA glutamyl-Q(34) synthetase GluQRS [Pirellulaceae bacterium]|nr:tRNA glutamyl-Q(34) synthetase GluQRS [Pirellulaceae bacterium]